MWANDLGISKELLNLSDDEWMALKDNKLTLGIVKKILDSGKGSESTTRSPNLMDIIENSKIDLQSTYIDGHFKKLSGFNSSEDLTGAKEELKRLQRLYHLIPKSSVNSLSGSRSPRDSLASSVPENDVFLKLLALPYLGKLAAKSNSPSKIPQAVDSAYAIKRMGRKSWLKNYSEYLGGEAVAAEIYENAAKVSAQAMILLSSYLDHINSPMYILPGFNAANSLTRSASSIESSDLPNWKELFGSLDLCQCNHCESIYGPASYFVDILHFLDTYGDVHGQDKKKIDGKTILDVLFERRKDLGNIKLNCSNTETPMPYIDLINEVLECAVINETDFSYQTTLTPGELEVNPENIKIEAYDKLRTSIYPFDLPFDLWRAQADAYLEKIGLQRYQVMRMVQSMEDDRQEIKPSDTEIAAVHLGLTPLDLDIIAGKKGGELAICEFWGLEDLRILLKLREGFNLSLLLKLSDLSYEEFSRLINTRFINPDAQIKVVFSEGADCDADKATIRKNNDPLPNAFFDASHRFLRLNRKLGWKVGELDRALLTFSATTADTLNENTIVKLSCLKQLCTELDLPIDECLSWWCDKMDTMGDVDDPSIYERIFLDKALDLKAFKLNDKRDEVEIACQPSSPRIKDHEAEILGALRIHSEDLRLLINIEVMEFNLSSLSLLYRNVSLSRALGLTIREFLSLKNLTGLNPFESPEVTIQLWNTLSKIRSFSFDIADLDYLIRDVHSAGRSATPSDDLIISALSSMREELRKIESKYIKQPEAKGEEVLKYLTLYLNSGEIKKFKEIVDEGANDPVIDGTVLEKLAFLSLEDKKKLCSKEIPEEKYKDIQEKMLDYERREEERKAIIARVSDIFQLDSRISDILVQNLLNQEDLNGLLNALISNEQELIRGNFPKLFDFYDLVNKAALILKGLNLSHEDLECQESIVLKDVHIKELILKPTINGFLDALDWAEFRGSLSKESLDRLFHPEKPYDPKEDFIKCLAGITGWDEGDLVYLTGNDAFNFKCSDDLLKLSNILRLKRIFDLLKRLGTNSQTLWSWRNHEITFASAQSIITAVKSKYAEDQWADLAKTLRNRLREEQRNALISYLLAHSQEALKKDLKTKDELFEHLLIDVEMAPCMLTSRIKQAISTVQLFVQRCFMNLEPQVKFDEDAAAQWAWMKNYRVWEADRKIFLYPENWIEPELRDDKTPLFKDMEVNLAQGLMNNSLAESAYKGYLNGLKDISNLKPVGIYQERSLTCLQLLEKTLYGHKGSIFAVAVTPDGMYAISGSTDKTLKVWDMYNGTWIRDLTGEHGHRGPIHALAVTPDGQYAISGSEDGILKVWDLKNGAWIRDLAGHTSDVRAIAVTPDRRYAISGSVEGILKVWDLQNGTWVRDLVGHNRYVLAVAITPDGRYAISGSGDKTLKVWDLQNGTCVRDLAGEHGHTSDVLAVAITPDGRYAISGSGDKTLKVWDLQNGMCVRDLAGEHGHTSNVLAVAITPGGRYAISGSVDKTLKVWDLQNGMWVHDLACHTSAVRTIAVAPDGRYAISGLDDYTLKVCDLQIQDDAWIRDLVGEGNVNAIAVTPDGRYAISSANSDNNLLGVLQVWDLQNGACVRCLGAGKIEEVRAVAVTPDGRYAISGPLDGTIKVWDLQDGTRVRDLAGHNGYVLAVAITPDGRYAISGSEDKTLKVWDLQNGTLVRDLAGEHGHGGWIQAVAITPDGRHAISGSTDKTLKVWDLQNGMWVRDLAGEHGHTSDVLAIAITPDGRYAISGSTDKTLKVWDLQNGMWVRDLAGEHGHASAVRTVAVTPDGRYAISGSTDKTLKVWDLQNGMWVRDLAGEHGHTSDVLAVAITPDGRYAVSGSVDKTLKVWSPMKVVLGSTHVIGRTFSEPCQYYHRAQIEGSWTPWKRIDANISGNHVLPVFHNKRLYIFWPMFDEANDGEEKGVPKKYYKISFAFIEYKDGKWSGQRRATAIIGDKNITKFWSKDDIVKILQNIYDIEPFFSDIISKEDISKIISNVAPKKFQVLVKEISLSIFKQSPELSEERKKLEVDLENSKADLLTTINVQLERFNLASKYETHNYSFELVQSADDGLQIYLFLRGKQMLECFRFVNGMDDLVKEGCYQGIPSILNPENTVSYNMGFESIDSKRLSINILKQKDITLLEKPLKFSLLMPRQPYLSPLINEDGFSFFFQGSYQGSNRLFFVDNHKYGFKFQIHYHPYIEKLITVVQAYGIDGLLNPKERWNDARDMRRQRIEREFFENAYLPTARILQPYPKEEIDFSYGGAYSNYNWEVFFQAIFLIANKLSLEQRFEEAQKWFHFIFDPTSTSPDPVPDRFWKVKPFCNMALSTPLGIVMLNLNKYSNQMTVDPILLQVIEEMRMQIEGWRRDPSNPHRIARLRISAYQKAVVMKYLDNLIAWGDYLFRQDTLESINQAIQLYVLANQILGKRPESIPARKSGHNITFKDVRKRLDEFSNFIINLENHVCLMGAGEMPLAVPDSEPLHLGPSLFFCIPKNENLLSYWDRVEDRLYKIRHCMNIEGTERSLALFEPPIDPGQLVRAVAAGAGAGTMPVTPVALPRYRFHIMLRKAMEFCSEVEGLGKAFLSVLEKKDAEGLERLSANQFKPNLKSIKEDEMNEIMELISGLEGSKQNAEKSIDNLIASAPDYLSVTSKITRKTGASVSKGASIGKAMISGKKSDEANKIKNISSDPRIAPDSEVSQKQAAAAGLALAQSMYTLEGGLTSVPTVIVGAAGISSPVSLVMGGGSQIKGKATALGQAFEVISTAMNIAADIMEIVQEFKSLNEERQNQIDHMASEIEKLEKDIKRAEIRQEIIQKEIANIDQQEKNAKEIDDYMRSKFTNLELYDWMVSQLSTLYFHAYNLAFDMAKQAEKAYQFELGIPSSKFVQYGQWDSLKKGLLSGEMLKLQLMRMEASYLEKNKREYEITKHISLATVNPAVLIKLIAEGQCEVELSEVLFDLDYPGQYMRRIKAISLTMDGEIDPCSTVSCKLTMVKNSMRVNTTVSSGYPQKTDGEDSRFVDDYTCVQSIVTSSGKEDSGLFELDMNDERYLPFEGAGVISKWHIELPNHDLQMGSNTIEDVVFNIRYTARDGGNELRDKAKENIKKRIDEARELLVSKGVIQASLVNYEMEKPLPLSKFNPGIPNNIQIASIERVDLILKSPEGPGEIKANITQKNISVAPLNPLKFEEKDGIYHASYKPLNKPMNPNDYLITFSSQGPNIEKVPIVIVIRYSVKKAK